MRTPTRSARYSGSDRPAWRMNQTGGEAVRSPVRARSSRGCSDAFASGAAPSAGVGLTVPSCHGRLRGSGAAGAAASDA